MKTNLSKRCHLEPLKSSMEYTEGSYNLTTDWQIGLTFYKLDAVQGDQQESNLILDEMDKLSTKFLQKLNRYAEDDDTTATQTYEITGIQKQPFIKVLADMMTGYIINFTLRVPDDFDYCSLYDN